METELDGVQYKARAKEIRMRWRVQYIQSGHKIYVMRKSKTYKPKNYLCFSSKMKAEKYINDHKQLILIGGENMKKKPVKKTTKKGGKKC